MAYEMGAPEIKEVSKAIRSGQLFRYGDKRLGWGACVDRFETTFAKHIGTKYAVTTNSGTTSLMASLSALGVGWGDEVIVPAYTFMATPVAVLGVGAIPIIADVDEGLGLDPVDMKKKVTARTKAVIPVHMMGLNANLKPILALARKKKLFVVEDCCQATGGSYRGKKLGSWGHMGAFSHNHYKTISSGEGGTVTTSKRDWFEKVMILQDAGSYFFDPRMRRFKDENYFAGFNYRMSELLAAMLNAQMKRLPSMVKKMNRTKKKMFRSLQGHPVCPPAPVHDLDGDCGKALFLRVESPELATKLGDALSAKGVPTSTWFRSLESDRHVYQNWWPILNKRGHVDKRQDPYKQTPAGKRVRYSKSMCPKALDYLGRSVAINIHPRWGESRVSRILSTVERLAKQI